MEVGESQTTSTSDCCLESRAVGEALEGTQLLYDRTVHAVRAESTHEEAGALT